MKIIHGDCLEELKKLEDNSIDAVVCDPPYGLSNTKPQQVADVLKAWVTGDTKVVPAGKGFMGKDWDSFVPPPAVWEECMRVLKPGGHMAVFAGARTQDLMGLSIRLAGFEIRDTLGWIFGSGFPKSHSVKRTTLKKVEERYGVARCDCLDTGDGQSDRHGVGQSGRGQAGAERGSRQIPPQETGDRTVSNVPCGSGDRVRELRGEGSEESGSLRQVEEPILFNGVRQCGTEEEGHGHAEVRAGVEVSEGRDSRKGRSVQIMRQESGGERERASCPSPGSVQVQRDEQAGEPSSAVRLMSSQNRGTDGQGFSIDPSRSNPRRIYPDSDGGWGEPVARVCSWCGLPDVEWLDGLDSLGTALKPAIEPIILARKSLDGTVAANVLAHGVGGLNIDACRVGTSGGGTHCNNRDAEGNCLGHGDAGKSQSGATFHAREASAPAGRFPANVLLDEHAAQEMDEQSAGTRAEKPSKSGNRGAKKQGATWKPFYTENENIPEYSDSGGASRFFPVFKYQAKAPKKERPVIYKNNCECEEWQSQPKATTESTATADQSWNTSTSGNSTTEKCQQDTTSTTSTMTSSTTESKTSNVSANSTISESTQDAKSETVNGGNHAESAESLNQSEQNIGISAKRDGHSTGDAGHVISEKWYTTSSCEKCGEPRLKVQHATVKPLALMEWLVSLIVPPGGTVLDPFAGSGTTLQAALNKGFQPIGIEQDADYIKLVEKRLEATCTTRKN